MDTDRSGGDLIDQLLNLGRVDCLGVHAAELREHLLRGHIRQRSRKSGRPLESVKGRLSNGVKLGMVW